MSADCYGHGNGLLHRSFGYASGQPGDPIAQVVAILRRTRAGGRRVFPFGYGGGALKANVDVLLTAPARKVGQIEDAHHVMMRAICQALVVG